MPSYLIHFSSSIGQKLKQSLYKKENGLILDSSSVVFASVDARKWPTYFKSSYPIHFSLSICWKIKRVWDYEKTFISFSWSWGLLLHWKISLTLYISHLSISAIPRYPVKKNNEKVKYNADSWAVFLFFLFCLILCLLRMYHKLPIDFLHSIFHTFTFTISSLLPISSLLFSLFSQNLTKNIQM